MRKIVLSVRSALLAFVGVLTLALHILSSYPAQPPVQYDERKIEGWTVYINRDLLKDDSVATRCVNLLQVQLFNVQRLVPPVPLEKLRKVPIWLELNDPQFTGSVYISSRNIRSGTRINRNKVGGIELAGAQDFLLLSINAPFLVLHELAHAYYDQVIGANNSEILAAFNAAKASGKYESVLSAYGRKRHYGMTNDREYFAEATEAFFGINDDYPFVHAELKEFDPQMEGVLRRVWAVDRAFPGRTVVQRGAPVAEGSAVGRGK